ncbi:MAG: phenylacetate--CoA ligase family protein [Chitinispirillaceae bacterium]
MKVTYWNKQAETLDAQRLKHDQLESLRWSVGNALKTPFYKRRLGKAGIGSPQDIRTLEDLHKIPFTTKDDLREAFPHGMLSCELDEVVRLHVSSGTTGTPTVIYHTRQDIDSWTELVARCMVASGATPTDVFQNMTTYGLFTGGLGMHYGAEKAGLLVIPASSGNTSRQLKLMQDFHTTIIHATPSYMLHIANGLQISGKDPKALPLKKAYLGAEPYSENTRRKIEELFDIDVYNSYGLSEMNGPGVAFECVYKEGMHVWEDAYLMEIIDPDTGESLEDGQEGEIVFTTLQRTATPLLRYRTRDLSMILPGECPCGRTHRRLSRMKGRNDDMLIVNGVNIFPSQIEELLMKVPEVGTNYCIQIDKKGSLDRMTVKTEIYSKLFTGEVSELESLRNRLREMLKAAILINPIVELHEPCGLPVTEGKAVRVIDNRPQE